jgi:ribonuclease T1
MQAWFRFLLIAWLAIGASLGLARENVTVDWVLLANLPVEAQRTVALIKQDGPFPYDRDGVTFGNYEKQLPLRQRGYYHEYTVKTPGSRNRGARRIIAGRESEFYYTDDHYRSFRRIQE